MSDGVAEELRLGVTGHRPNRLEGVDIAVLRRCIREVLLAIASAAGNVTVLSSLAEGADRLVAWEALAAGQRLICPLPFPRDAYEHDFPTVASRAEYHALLGRAGEVIELPGTRDTPEAADAAYTAAGHYILGASDVLLAVWDGGLPRGSGGTAHIVEDARARRIPVIWISTQTPHQVCTLIDDRDTGHHGDTPDAVSSLIADHFQHRRRLPS